MNTWKKQFIALGLGVVLTLGSTTFANATDSVDDSELSFKENFLKSIKEYKIKSSDKDKINTLIKEIDKIDSEKKALDKKAETRWTEIDKILRPYEIDILKSKKLPTFEDFLKENEIKAANNKNVLDTLNALYEKLNSYQQSGDLEKYDEIYFDIIKVCGENELFTGCDFEINDDDQDDNDDDQDDDDNKKIEIHYKRNPIDEVSFYNIDEFIKEMGSKIKKQDIDTLKNLQKEMKRFVEKKDSKNLEKTFEKIENIFKKYD